MTGIYNLEVEVMCKTVRHNSVINKFWLLVGFARYTFIIASFTIQNIV